MTYPVHNCSCKGDSAYFDYTDVTSTFEHIMSLRSRGIDSMGPYEDIPTAYDLLLPAAFAAFEEKFNFYQNNDNLLS